MSAASLTMFPDATPSPRTRRKKAPSAPVFKPYLQRQGMLLPPNLEEMIPPNHLVRIVNESVDQLDIEVLRRSYKGSGTSAYQPVMLLKVLVYAYVTKIYSSRRIAKALREDVNFMWLAAMSQPDFRTINGFRSGRLKPVIDEVFGSMVVFLIDNNYVDVRTFFVDGTKIQADNNRHKVVWAKNTERYKKMCLDKINEQLVHIEEINQEENRRYGDRDLEELGHASPITSEAMRRYVQELNEQLRAQQQETSSKPTDDDARASATPEGRSSVADEPQSSRSNQEAPCEPQASAPSKAEQKAAQKAEQKAERKRTKRRLQLLKKLANKFIPRLETYEEQERILLGRNSYAKTDTDATVFRMKDKQLLPAYNVLVGTQDQFILNYSFYQDNASESEALIAHLQRFKALIGTYPSLVMGDGAYGSEENYAFLEKEKIENYLKYNTFHQDLSGKYRNPYHKALFVYNEETNTYVCPEGRVLQYLEQRIEKTKNGYVKEAQVYECRDCSGCPVAQACKRGEGNRTIQINKKLDAFRAEARKNLTSEKGIALRKKRGIDVEPVFGDIKFNQDYKRFRLRGKDKVKVEMGILSIAHNTKKIARRKGEKESRRKE